MKLILPVLLLLAQSFSHGVFLDNVKITDTTPPAWGVRYPSGAGVLPGTSTTLTAVSTDDCGVLKVCFYWYYCGGGTGCVPPVTPEEDFTLIGCDYTAVADEFSYLFTYPNCASAPLNNVSIGFKAYDKCGQRNTYFEDDQLISQRGC